jgi:hypothetical protein
VTASDVEWAWAAGFFEGDGNVYVPPPSQGRGLRLTLSQSSPDDGTPPNLLRFHRIVGCGAVHPVPASGLSRRQRWVWRVQRRADAERVLAHLRCYMT